ncbi:MAG: hypothetical protein AAFY20_04160 [Cyanobacteria bacterium J06639_14]
MFASLADKFSLEFLIRTTGGSIYNFDALVALTKALSSGSTSEISSVQPIVIDKKDNLLGQDIEVLKSVKVTGSFSPYL